MAQQFSNVLSNDTIEYILSRPEVAVAKTRIDMKTSSANNVSEYFTIPLTPILRSELFDRMGLQLSNVTSIPMRWIKGDTPAHIDNGVSTFTHTHLVYLSNSHGNLIVDGISYPITRGVGYRFSEGVSHETTGTARDAEPRLLLGPMSDTGFVVGGPSTTTFQYPGGTVVYIRQSAAGQAITFSVDGGLWSTIVWPVTIRNTNTSTGFLHVLFESSITIDASIGTTNGYFICDSDKIQIGSANLKDDGSRSIITVDGVANYPGFIYNGNSVTDGYNTIYVSNIELRASGGSTLANEAGWVGQVYFGKGTTASSNLFLNCHSTGNTSNYCGGISGRYSGPIKCVNCSSSGVIGTFGGGIIGADSPSTAVSLTCDSCWSTGVIGHYGGGITGQSTGRANFTNCYSTGNMNQNAGGISGRYSGSYHFISDCYSRGSIGDYGGGIIGSECGEVIITNCYSTGAITNWSGGILGNQSGNSTNKTVMNCYAAGTPTHVNGGYMIPGYSDLTGVVNIVNGDITLANNARSTGWSNVTANTALTGYPASSSAPIGTKWVHAGTNTPYEIYAMGYTPYSSSIITGPSMTMVRSFSSSVVAGKPTQPALISGQSYSILEITGGDNGSYSTITINATTGRIQTTTATVPGTYILAIRNTGSYHFTTYTLIVSPYVPYSLFGTFTNNAQVFYKSHSLASGGVGGVRNYRRKARKT